MKNLILSLALTIVGSTASAIPDGKFKCVIVPTGAPIPVVKLRFEIKDGDVKCHKMADAESCETWFGYSPKRQNKFWLDGLVDGGFSDDAEGNWKVDADSDGCNIGKLTLYKNSGFKRGFISSKFNCSTGNPSYAGKVSCTID